MEVLFNKQGTPLVAFGDKAYFTTIGEKGSGLVAKTKIKKTKSQVEPVSPSPTSRDVVSVPIGKYQEIPWGENDDFPVIANNEIEFTPVLRTGLKYKIAIALGQGIFPCKVTGYDKDGNETLEVVNDKEVIKLLKGRTIRRYLEEAIRDITKFGRAFPQLILTNDGTKIDGVYEMNAYYTRLTKMVKGKIEAVVVSGYFPDKPIDGEYDVIQMLDEKEPLRELIKLREGEKLGDGKITSLCYPLTDSFSNYPYYPTPDWWTAKLAGWIDIAHHIPTFLDKMYQNQVTWKWHIKIPYAYWDKRYPEAQYSDVEKRQKLIKDEMQKIEDSICGVDNAGKAIFSGFEVNISGKAEEMWIIEALDNKSKADENLITSAAANSEILFSIMVNPSVLGAGMPGGGVYSGGAGSGSDIREAFLVNIILAWLIRQNVLDPIEAMLQFNGYDDIELRFRNITLTTLDTGGGTAKKLS